MHGLINRSVQCFIRDTYGPRMWLQVALDARIGIDDFEAMLNYDDDLTFKVLTAARAALDKPIETILEDMGTYLVSHPTTEALRRLLRFGGETFVDFLYSLDDLSDRARLALPGLDLPALELHEKTTTGYQVLCAPGMPGFAYVMIGILRTMADDYGALVVLEHQGQCEAGDCIDVSLLEAAFTTGRRFELAAGVAI